MDLVRGNLFSNSEKQCGSVAFEAKFDEGSGATLSSKSRLGRKGPDDVGAAERMRDLQPQALLCEVVANGQGAELSSVGESS
jgi:hypothetical protein